MVISRISTRAFDFHCHVDLHPNPPNLIRECEERRIKVFAVTTTPKAWPQNREWTNNSKYVHTGVGLHPELVGERFAEIDLLEENIADTRLVGEIGLDGSPQYLETYSRQKEVFKRALISAQKHGGRVITVHSRRAARDVIEAIENHTDQSRVLCIMHWFSGSHAELRRAAELGCYFSVNSAMLQHERGIKLIQSIPRERLLTETDSPFTSVNGKKSVPWNTIDTCGQLACLLDESRQVIGDIIAENACQVFQFANITV